uniref:Uncharacterized protein n=1 Tax=Panagrolaimus superbus TaxID=310955 RepID=A0A914XUG8_9BILA
MLYFPDTVKFCASLTTNKNVLTLSKDRQRTTFLQPLLSIGIKEIGVQHRCQINFMGYGGEYRLSPDLGYYTHCQRSISQYINQLVDGEPKPEWNASNPQCPIQELPNSYKDYLACDLVPLKWYELDFESSMRYEVFHKKTYQQFTSNYSTTFLFKPDYFLERNGSEADWLTRLIEIKAKLKGCKKVRYFIRIDDQWKLPITVHIEYRITHDGLIKYSHHVGSGTIEHWFSGSFPFIRSPSRDHE